MKKTLLVLAAIMIAAVVSANALTPAQISTIDDTISGAKLRNVSSVATEMVEKSAAADRKDIAVQIVRSVKSYKAGALVQTVAAISKENPELAPAVAAAAASLSNSQAVKIAKVASAAAPAYANQIAKQVSTVAPKYSKVILAATATVEIAKDISGAEVTAPVEISEMKPVDEGPRRPAYTAP